MSGAYEPVLEWELEMDSVTSSEAREKLADIVGKAEFAKKRTAITKHGKAVAMIVPIEDLKLLARVEDFIDYETAIRALNDPLNQEDRISHADMKRRLGIPD